MGFRIIDSETGETIMDAGDIASLIETIDKLGDQYKVKQLDIFSMSDDWLPPAKTDGMRRKSSGKKD